MDSEMRAFFAGLLLLSLTACAPTPPPAFDYLRAIQDLAAQHEWGEDPAPAAARFDALVEAANNDIRAADPQREAGVPALLSAVLSPLLYADWDDPLLAAPRAWMDRHSAVFDAMEELAGAGSHRVRFSVETLTLPLVDRPEIESALRETEAHFTRPSLAEGRGLYPVWMRSHAEAGEWDAFIAASRAGLRAARRAMSAPRWSGLAAASATEDGVLREIRLAARLDMPADGAHALIDLLRQEGPLIDALVPATIRGDAVGLHELLWLLAYAYDRESVDWINELSSGISDDDGAASSVWRMPPRRFVRAGAEIDAWAAAIEHWWTHDRLNDPPPISQAEHPMIHRWLRFSAAGTVWMLESRRSIATTRAATIITLRLAAHRATYNRWPVSLSDAMPDAETLDPLSGEAFEYELRHDEAGGLRPSLFPPHAAGAFYATTWSGEQREQIIAGWRTNMWERPALDTQHHRWLERAPLPPAPDERE